MSKEVAGQLMINQEITIRQATVEDASTLAALIRQSFLDVARQFGLTEQNCPTHPSNCQTDWVIADLQMGKTYYVAEKGQPIGCVAFEYRNPESGYLGRLAVLPSFRSGGVGRSLVRTVETHARCVGLRRLEIAIIGGNVPLRQWYVRLGFDTMRIEEFAHLPFKVEFMNKELI